MIYVPPPDECARRFVDGVARCYVEARRDEILWAVRSIARAGCSPDEALDIVGRYPGVRSEELIKKLRELIA